jgi:hypothetical protein
VKKKSPPYAFIGAILLFFIALIFLVQWKKSQDQKAADAVAAQKAADDKVLADAQEKQISVAPTATNMRTVLYATQPVEPGVLISPAFYEKKLTPTDILPDAYTDQSDITGWVA